MFVVEGAVDHALEARREARRRRLRSLGEQEARIARERMRIVREADDEGDWKAAGCASSAAWLAQVSRSDYRTAARIARTSEALRELPALDRALGEGLLNLDQVAAAAEFATPSTDAELARVAVDKAPSEVGLIARSAAPPKVADDRALYARRSLRMRWTRGRRELEINGRLPLELGAVVEQTICDVAKALRAADKQDGAVLEWPQYAADALVALAQQHGGSRGQGRTRTTLIVHVGDDAPPAIEGAGPVSAETAERLACDARRLTIKRTACDLVHSRVGRCASYAQQRALQRRSPQCQYPGCTVTRDLEAHHLIAAGRGGKTELANLILLCGRHHKHLHDHHIRTGGSGEEPTFTDQSGRAIMANRPHAPPG
jgi:hypothetical protein